MSLIYSQKKHTDRKAGTDTSPVAPSFDALRTGAAAPTAEQMGHRVDLPDAMREKMENAFGADLSAVKLYESDTVRDAGVKAVAQGSNIAFAPGVLDFSSYGGQAILGHELSHVVSQARGEVTGSGLLNDPALEARADREGAMAAAGQQIAVPSEAMSPVTAAPAAGPMQCFGKKKDPYRPFQKINPSKAGKNDKGEAAYYTSVDDHDRDQQFVRKGWKNFAEELQSRYTSDEYDMDGFAHLGNGQDVRIMGLSLSRMSNAFGKSLGDGYSKEQIIEMYDNLMAPHRKDLDKTNADAVAAAQDSFGRGVAALKDMHLTKLKRLESTYGTLPSQMHPRDFMNLAGKQYNDHFHLGQDTQQLMDGAARYFDYNDPKDKELKTLQDYYYSITRRNHLYSIDEFSDSRDAPMNPDLIDSVINTPESEHKITPEMEAAIHGPSLSPEQQESYLKDLHKRFARRGWTQRLFGRFRLPDDPKRQP